MPATALQTATGPATGSSDLAVILLHWRNEAAIWHQVERLLNWRNPPEIWVVENEPLSQSPVQNPRLYRITPAGNLGYAGGINAAWRAMSSSDVTNLLLINTDLEIEEQDVRQLQQGLEESRAAIIGPLLMEPGRRGSQLYAGGRDPVCWTHTRVPIPKPATLPAVWPRVAYVPGTVCLMRREVMDRLGGLDEAFFFSGEIADLCLRARAQGFHATVHHGVVIRHHTEAADDRRSTLYLYYSLRNRFLLVQRHRIGSAGFWRCIWFARGLFMILLRLARGQGASARAAWLAIHDGWSEQFGPNSHAFPA